LKKKLIVIGSIIVIIVGIALGSVFSHSNSKSLQDYNEPKIVFKGDVIMPTKVSRPGCEKTDSCYIPSKITIKQNDSVTWVNYDAAFGTYDYFCTLHPWMKGQVTVELT
jgi:hypothetical protein